MAGKQKNQNVWRIVEHDARLQSTGGRSIDVLINSSPYIQFPVHPKDAEIILFKQQLDSLLSDVKKRPAWMTFWLLAQWSFDTEVRFKGFLLDVTRQPASNAFLAERIGLTVSDIRKHLAVLEKAGLMERVEWEDPSEKPRPKSRNADWRKRARENDGKKGQKSTGKKTKNGGKNTGKSARPSGDVTPDVTLSRTTKRQNGLTALEGESQSGLTALNDEGKSSAAPAAPTPPRVEGQAECERVAQQIEVQMLKVIQFPNGVTEIEDVGNVNAKPEAEARSMADATAGQTTPGPTSTRSEVVRSPFVDAEEGSKPANGIPIPDSTGTGPTDPPRSNSFVTNTSDNKWIADRYGLQVSIWTLEIYEALGRPAANDGRQKARELGTIASACSRHGYGYVHSKSLHHARGLAKKNPGFFKTGIVPAWNYVLKKRLENAGGNVAAG